MEKRSAGSSPEQSPGQVAHVAALGANRLAYANEEERRYIEGAPHVKHRSVQSLHASLVETTLHSRNAPSSSARVLDLGAGSGLACGAWLDHGAQITAVDCSAKQLMLLTERARRRGASVRCATADAADFASRCQEKFDVVTVVSTLHHVPDYLALVRDAARLVVPGGALLTFQDPIRYDTLPRAERAAGEAAYLLWRLGRGHYVRGVRTRWRRMRGVMSDTEGSDNVEYHVVRAGVDAASIQSELAPIFQDVQVTEYWSTQSSTFQWIGDRLGLRSTFAIVALGRVGSPAG